MSDIDSLESPGIRASGRATAATTIFYGRNLTFPRPTAASYSHRYELPAIVTEGESCRLRAEQQESNSCSDGQLSGVMPDVAMATASFGALQLIEEQELELDLGDGTSHLLQHVSSSTGTVGSHRSSLQRQHQRHFSGPPHAPYIYHRAGTALPRFI